MVAFSLSSRSCLLDGLAQPFEAYTTGGKGRRMAGGDAAAFWTLDRISQDILRPETVLLVVVTPLL